MALLSGAILSQHPQYTQNAFKDLFEFLCQHLFGLALFISISFCICTKCDSDFSNETNSQIMIKIPFVIAPNILVERAYCQRVCYMATKLVHQQNTVWLGCNSAKTKNQQFYSNLKRLFDFEKFNFFIS